MEAAVGETGEAEKAPCVIYSAKCNAINVAVERLGWAHLQRVEENLPKQQDEPSPQNCPKELSEWRPKVKRNKVTGLPIRAIPSFKFRPWTMCWVDLNEQTDQILMGLKPYQKVNKTPGMCELVRKKRLGVNLKRLAKILPDVYDFFPKTWVIPREKDDLLRDYAQMKKKGMKPIFICKPVSGARGNGIWMTKDVYKIDPCASQVVQRYLNSPHLIHGRKFDMRVYALITCNNPIRVYVYKEGIARFATEKYTPANDNNLDNLYTHLTNYSINKMHKDFFSKSSKKEIPSGKWTISRLFKFMKEEQKIDTRMMWARIKDVILKTFISVSPMLAERYKGLFPNDYTGGLCFELVGFDIMLDSELNAYVLEVNRNPSLNMSTPLDVTLKGDVTADTLRLVNPMPVDRTRTEGFIKLAMTRHIQADPTRLPSNFSTQHPKVEKSWQEVRNANRKALGKMTNVHDFKKWLDKRRIAAHTVRETAEDALIPYTNYERIYPLVPPEDKKTADQTETEEEFKLRATQIQSCFKAAREAWRDELGQEAKLQQRGDD
ncbi:hypothetical protein AAMO2058_000881900 [Amorphochlora amoebiformis]